MINKLVIKNFKRLGEVELNLEQVNIFIGPNNSGKTSAIQAITLWDKGLRLWYSKRINSSAKKRTGVTINRTELFAIPARSSRDIWKDLAVRESIQVNNGRSTKNIKIEITAFGQIDDRTWNIGFEYDYANQESFYCRLITDQDEFNEIAKSIVNKEKIGYLPPMSGLSTYEDKLEMGSILVRIGEGRTAEVIRNLCYLASEQEAVWKQLQESIVSFFGIKLNRPRYDPATGQIFVSYIEHEKEFDLTNSGKGFQQLLLILSYIYSQENSILMLDEPDAHLELLRQKRVFRTLSSIVKDNNSQLFIATHSEAVLNEAIGSDNVIAFIGDPHPITKKDETLKALTTYGFENYIQAEQKGWVLYLEGATDLLLLKAFAKKLDHPLEKLLKEPFVHYVGNKPHDARSHFYALKEAFPDLIGIALYDNFKIHLQENALIELMWERNEIENYIPLPITLLRSAELRGADSKELNLWREESISKMKEVVEYITPKVALDNPNDEFWVNEKISDNYLRRIFQEYSKKLNLPNQYNKSKYYKLISFAEPHDIAPEISEKLNIIYEKVKNLQ